MLLQLNRTSSRPLYLQLADQLRGLILSGTLPDGHRLPPERQLATTLQVNRTTILAAYRELKAGGFASAHVGQGTLVTTPGTGTPEAVDPGTLAVTGTSLPPSLSRELAVRPLFSQEAARTQTSLTRDLLALTGKPNIISFAAGIPIPDLEPLPEIASLLENLVATHGQAMLHHTPTEGLSTLREAIARYEAIRGIPASAADLLVLSGSQQGLDLLARMMLDPGDTVLVEEPTFFCARQIFESRGARVASVRCDAEGILPDNLEEWLARTRPKFLYLIPTFHNPTGRTMSLARRREVLDVAEKHQLLLIEDDAYNGLRYEGMEQPPLKALDTHGLVVYLGSFSKLLFMGLRIGWMHAPREILRQAAIHRQLSDIHASSVSQWMVQSCLDNGLLERHRQRALVENRSRRNRMLSALQIHLTDIPGISWNRPEGGLYIWLTLPRDAAPHKVAAIAGQLGVAYVPGNVFSVDGSSADSLRLNFTYPSPDQIEEGIRLLGRAIREARKPDPGLQGADPVPLAIL